MCKDGNCIDEDDFCPDEGEFERGDLTVDAAQPSFPCLDCPVVFALPEEGNDFEAPCSGFKCSNGPCIEWAEVCNGRSECPDGSDEHNCPGERRFASLFHVLLYQRRADENHCREHDLVDHDEQHSSNNDEHHNDDDSRWFFYFLNRVLSLCLHHVCFC